MIGYCYLTATLIDFFPILAITIVPDIVQEATPQTADDKPISFPSAE